MEKEQVISLDRFVKNMSVACLLYNFDTNKNPKLIQIVKGFKALFPTKIEELDNYMFYTNFGKTETGYLSYEDFYQQLIN